ncbi:ribonuclease HI [Campylobacter blaseri]|uniref:Ribonuclease H n=1 Tax=Campylobacter blaseri TaxID=2042961 RepID=A0A2P8R3N5_9BACT|nr:ribonuclease HI [Campylobacter blaseri]PSM53098.1 ribonuclease HI [Campylobacter blaseri]PSM54565.1 ribonuclease HI [Campylobacter blaseri]QKF86964.1 ribonuclease HI [Campylobacter blaseri]
MKSICLFSDGSCLGNPGIGGWAYILDYKGKEKKQSGAQENTTNNQMELLAVINGLKALKEPCEVTIYTDSSYVANAINLWLTNWIKKDFKNVKNIPLWKEYIVTSKKHKIKAIWIKGHAGHPQNEECDKMARNEAINLQKVLTR